MRARWLLALSILSACAAEDLVTDEVQATDDGKADASSELKVRVSDTSLWVTSALERRGDAFVLRGRTSRTISDGNAFVFDDVYGDFTHATPRTFEVSFAVSTAHTVIDGINLFTSLSFAGGKHLTERAVVRPRLVSVTGPTTVSLTAELTPVVVAGRTFYRVSGRSTQMLSNVIATAAGTAVEPRLVDPTHFQIDLTADQVFALTAPAAELYLNPYLPTGGIELHARLALVVKRLGLSASDASVVWPSPACTATTKSCLLALADGALDLGSCGEAIKVRVCQGQVGVVVDAPSTAAALAAATTKLADPAGFGADAKALVGADHAAVFASKTRDKIAARLADEQGKWLVTHTARSTVLSLAVESALDGAYARPLQLVAAHAPVPGNLGATRQVVADGLLAYLATQDYLHSEFGRSLEQLGHEFRAMHVQSLREFRETVAPDTTQPTTDVYIGQWLGTHTEISVDRATGVVTNVLVELD
jgi:hypothetical protein